MSVSKYMDQLKADIFAVCLVKKNNQIYFSTSLELSFYLVFYESLKIYFSM